MTTDIYVTERTKLVLDDVSLTMKGVFMVASRRFPRLPLYKRDRSKN